MSIDEFGRPLMVADARLAERLAEIDRAGSSTALVVSGDAANWRRARSHDASAAHDAPAATCPRARHAVGHACNHLHLGHDRPLEGRAVLLPAPRRYREGARRCSTPDDRALVNLPLFHVGGTDRGLPHVRACGGSIALVESFDTATFWDTDRARPAPPA